MQLIGEFYKNRDILITGGLGFIGKVLIEKLLRSCSDVNKIFVLIRGKNDKTAIERLEFALNLPLFEQVRSKDSEILKKVIPIVGNISADNLGISNDDVELLKNVSIVIHSAATVRFIETLQDCILTNTKGTFEILKFSEKLENLKCFVHVSTTFCNLDRDILDEKIYEPYEDWKKILDFAVNSNTTELNNLAEKYSKYYHNNYTLSKHFAEQICEDFKHKIPLVVFRPAIVTPTVSEPMPGWIDNFYGPVALNVAGGIGIARCFYGKLEGGAEYTPVDISVKIILLSAYRRAAVKDSSNNYVYNCSDTVATSEIIHYALFYIKENPYEKTFWVPNVTVTNSYIYYLMLFLIFQFLPALLIDTLLIIFQQKPFLTRLQKKLYSGNVMVHKFISHKWKFVKNNMYDLESLIKPEELEKFSFTSEIKINLKSYMKHAIVGTKLYLFNEPAECTQKAKLKVKIMYWVDKICKILFFYWIIKKFYTFLK